MGLFAQIAPGDLPPPLRGGRTFVARPVRRSLGEGGRAEKVRVGGNHARGLPPTRNFSSLRLPKFRPPRSGGGIVHRFIVYLLLARSRFSRHRTIMS
jgi:hypothetical protein